MMSTSLFVFADNAESVAIVPLTEPQENAMESTVFKALLKRCGIKPPANEQVPNAITVYQVAACVIYTIKL